MLKLRASGWRCLAGDASIFRYVSPRDHGLGVARAGVEDHSPEPPGLGQDGEVSQGQVAVDALVDAAELVGMLEGQDPPPAGFGLGRLAGLAVEDGLAEEQLGGVGVVP